MRALALVLGCVLVSGLATTACGAAADTTPPPRRTTLSGDRVAATAERELEAQNPRLAPGTMSCPALPLVVGREVRCQRVVVLPGGREVRMAGSVRVATLAGPGRLHVQLEDRVSYGVSAVRLAADLRARLRHRGIAVSTVSCPWLSGPVGTVRSCTAATETRRLVYRVRVVARDDAHHRTRFTWLR